MYDRAETAEAHDALWAGVRDGLRARDCPAPPELTRTRDLWAVWEDPNLVLGQTCNLPFRQRLHDRVSLIGSPDLNLPETPPGHYRSLFVVRRGNGSDLLGYAERRFAFNQSHSHSGWAAAQLVARKLGFQFRDTLETGAHALSAQAVAEERADIAAIDAHTWRALTAFDGDTVQKLEVIGHTDASPAPPYISAPGQNAALIGDALERALTDLAAPHRAMLGIAGLVRLSRQDYLSVPALP